MILKNFSIKKKKTIRYLVEMKMQSMTNEVFLPKNRNLSQIKLLKLTTSLQEKMYQTTSQRCNEQVLNGRNNRKNDPVSSKKEARERRKL